MAVNTRIEGDAHVNGTLTCTKVTILGTGSANAVSATKLQHQHSVNYHQADGADVAAALMPIYICRGTTGTVVAFEAACVDAPSTANEGFTVDLQKANQAATTAATILSADITITTSVADMQVMTATISTANISDGDTLFVEVGTPGTTATKGQGLICTVTIREDAD